MNWAATMAMCSSAMVMTVADGDTELARSLELAGGNRAQIEQALASAPADQRAGVRWLIAHMPPRDLQTLSAEFLLQNCAQAYAAWRTSPWHSSVDEALFFDCILPYASINETRDEWRGSLRDLCAPLIATAKSPAEAAVIINRELFSLVGVKYSTKRKRADQSPRESMESGLASCTGLSILLVDACRSVGVPARFAGIPMWVDMSGNHSWVEVWDGTWHFTGAAEATGADLDKAWFADKAATTSSDDLSHAIYAVTWRDSPLDFPPAWRDLGEDHEIAPVRAINVTDRYIQPSLVVPAGHARVRFRVTDQSARRSVAVTVKDSAGTGLFTGVSKDESADTNDHLTVMLPLGQKFTVSIGGAADIGFTVERDEQLVEIRLPRDAAENQEPSTKPSGATAPILPPAPPGAEALQALRGHLAKHGVEGLSGQAFAATPLSKSEAAAALEFIWKSHSSRSRAQRKKELASGTIELGSLKMPIWFKTFGKKPVGGHSLFISMHGGGGAPPQVNDQQWENQKRLYEPSEGIYVVPRAPTDTWNLWHESHIDALLTRLIEDMVIVEGVNPDRVYIMGYSAGGDGVYQLAPRMADQLAAAAMMAGHPNETKPDGLRNLPFALHVGENDAPFDRNKIGAQWKTTLADLAAHDPGGYPHLVEIHKGKGHWMDRDDASAVAWMARFTRNGRPLKIIWLQDDVTHNRFYWLATRTPHQGARAVVTRDGQAFSIEQADGFDDMALRLDDSMCDLDQPIVIKRADEVIFTGVAPRTIGTIAATLLERGDPRACFAAEVSVSLNK